MKELSIEEKAKRYDEAIDKAKKELDACGSQDCDAARQIFRLFSELKESEDEKIRKELIDFLKEEEAKADITSKHSKTLCKYIVWLEKQGEQKPQRMISAEAKEAMYGKPTAWSEEDEKAINDILWIIEAYRKDGFNETHIQMADNSEKWLKSIKQRIIE